MRIQPPTVKIEVTSLLFVLLMQFVPYPQSHPHVLMEGAWSSCPESDGEWTERSLRHFNAAEHRVDWTLHMGPRDEFALFAKDADLGAHRDHDGESNVLTGYHFASEHTTSRHWTAPALHLYLSVVRVNGSRATEAQCENFYVMMERK